MEKLKKMFQTTNQMELMEIKDTHMLHGAGIFTKFWSCWLIFHRNLRGAQVQGKPARPHCR